MPLTANAYTVTTGLMAAFALFVVFIRLRNWVDSNVPILFYIAMIVFMRSVEGTVPIWLILVSFALSLTLRFEFMNAFFTRLVKYLEVAALAVIVYLCASMILKG